MNTPTINKARDLWSYLSAVESSGQADAVVICCSYDLRVCDHACDLVRSGCADTLIISGKSGNWTRQLWCEPEAQVFAARARANGIAENQILLETEATNFGENVKFSRTLIPAAKKVMFVTKPNALLRLKLTARAQWSEVESFVSAPKIEFPAQISNVIGIWGVINEMVGDIDRIQKYPALGYQAPHTLPPNILKSWEYLVDQGFTHHLIARSEPPTQA